MSLSVPLYFAAFVCFVLGTVGVPARIGWMPLGLAIWLFTATLLPKLPLAG